MHVGMKRAARLIGLALAALAATSGSIAHARSGAALFADVETYVAHGDHLVGYPGAERTAAWIEARLRQLGYEVRRQSFGLRQYRGAQAVLTINGTPIAAALQWWPPDARGGLRLAGPVGRGAGAFAVIPVSVGDQSYLGGAVEAQIRAAIAEGAAAVLLQTATSLGADGPYLFNAREQAEPWPVPVLAISAQDGARLTASPGLMRLAVDGRYEAATAANILARLDRPQTDRAVIISTPYTGWGPCGGERGPGIAMFLALADWARAHVPYDIVLVATAGHEVGHSGIAQFLASRDAPPPAATALWLHLGASIAAYARVGATEANSTTRYALFSPSLAEPAKAHLAGPFVPVDTAVTAFGEVADVARAGYPHHLGFAGYGPHHHLPSDTAASTGPELLEDAWERVVATLPDVLETGRADKPD